MVTLTKNFKFFERKSKTPLKKLSVLTAYDFNTAYALEQAGVDLILVGDSLAMVALGYEDTTQVTAGEMLTFTKAVLRGAPNTTVVADIPLLSIKKELSKTIEDCKKFIEAGADLVKIENAEPETLELLLELKKLDIPFMGHIGYTPQRPEKFTGSKMITDEELLLSEAKALENAGALAIVLEVIPDQIAKKITETLSIPTVGIGAGKDCDGQVLVTDDLLGRYPLFKPKFVKRYDEQHESTVNAFKNYINDVKSESFPL